MRFTFIQIILLWGSVLTTAFTQEKEAREDYPNALNRIHKIQSNTTLANSVAADSLFHLLATDVFPAWYGTPWDFNGISNVPGKGEIACGYFVSTTLKHAGFNLNRFKLAQQDSRTITTEICGSAYTQTIHGFGNLVKHLYAFSNGFFVVGLDNHVGFIVIENGREQFVHSDYISGEVISERVEYSEALRSSSQFVLGQMSENPELIDTWVQRTQIFKK